MMIRLAMKMLGAALLLAAAPATAQTVQRVEGLRLQLVAAGVAPPFSEPWTPEAQRQALRAFQARLGLTASGIADGQTIDALKRATERTIAKWDLKAYTHPLARTVQLIPIGIGSTPVRTPTGLAFRSPDGSASIDYAMVPSTLDLREIHDRLTARGAIRFQKITPDLSIVETISQGKVVASRYERKGQSVVGWTFGYEPSKWPDGPMIASAMTIPTTSGEASRDARSGSGFAVSQAGHVVTNAHVVRGCDTVTTSRTGDMRILARDEETDLAVLERVPSSGPALAPIALRTNRIKLGETAYALGFPLSGTLGSGLNFTNGIVSSLAGLRGDPKAIQFTSPIQPGSSGGPLLDSTGAVIGVIVAKFDDGELFQSVGQISQNVNFALRPDTLAAFLKRSGVPYEPAQAVGSSDATAIAEFGEERTVQVVCRP